MKTAIIGKKVGMTQIFDEAGKVVPVTVIEAGPCTVTGKMTKEKEGYDFILSYVEGGPVLVADAKYDITAQVLKQLNEEESVTPPVDTTAKK